MMPTVNPQQMQAAQPMMLPIQDFMPQMPIPQMVSCPAIQPGVMPVYNSIPYNPVYGQSQNHQHRCAPDVSTVKIELNGLEPPKVPGYNDYQNSYSPVYPGFTQMAQAPQYSYQSVPQMMPQQTPIQVVPQYAQPVGIQQASAIVPPAQMIGAIPPSPQYVQPQSQTIAPPPPAIDQVSQAAPPPVAPVTVPMQENPQEAVKPLLDALSIISPKQGAPEPTFDVQAKAVQTIAQFARVAEASDQIYKKDPNNIDAKQTKEKVDTLVKPNLIKEETFLGLADIAVKDTSKLSAEDRKKADENRIISMWALSMLQKLFKQEMNQEAKKINIPTISMNEVPGIVQVVNLVQKDPNPLVREAGVAALANIADPQDKKDVDTMKTVLSYVAQKDSADNVKKAATEALSMYQ